MTSLKRDKLCPQCEHRKMWFLSRVLLPMRDVDKMSSQAVPMALGVEIGWLGVKSQGAFEAFICAQCGWTEWYAINLGELRENPGAGVHFVDAEPKAGLR